MSAVIQVGGGDDVYEFINCSTHRGFTLETSITWNTATLGKSTVAQYGVLNVPTAGQGTAWAEDSPTGIANANSLVLHGPANDTSLNINYLWRNYRRLNIDKLVFNICFGMNASANAGNDVSFDSVTARVQKFQSSGSGSPYNIIPTISRSTGFGLLTGAGTQCFILQESYAPNLIIDQNDYLLVSLTMGVTAGTATRQEGIVPLFSYQSANVNKWYSQSGILLIGHYVKGTV